MRLRALSLSTTVLLALSGCTEFNDARHQEKAYDERAQTTHIPARELISTSDKPYLIGEPVKPTAVIPPLLREAITISWSRPLSLREAATQLSIRTGIPIRVRADADETAIAADTVQQAGLSGMTAPAFNGTSLPAPPAVQSGVLPQVPKTVRRTSTAPTYAGRGPWLEYTGTRHGLFATLATRFGVSERFTDGTEEFFRNITKTYVIPAFEEKTTDSAMITTVAGGGGGSNTGSGMGNMGGGMSAGMSGGMGSSGGSGGNQGQGMTGASVQSTTDRLAHLQEAALQAGNGADVLMDAGLGTLTATGTPEQIAGLDEWYDGMKAILTKQVAITLRVWALKFDRESNYGVSPQVAAKQFSKYFVASATPAAIPLIQSQSTPFSFGAQIVKGKMNGTDLSVQALQSLNNATELDERGIVTTNGVPAPFQHGTTTAYVQYASSYLATNAGSSSSQSPGYIMAGFEGLVTPRISDDQIVLNLHFQIQTLLSLALASGTSGMQLPTTSSTIQASNIVLKNGEMLVLSGYSGDSTKRQMNGVGSPYNWLFGGGGDADNVKNRILITVEAHTL
ncbi:pilus assembly protein PilN [Acetobacter suratthaniensis]|uniref:Pilus assembly protein PilN n=1 Tax=Acetobacter suratthaniensis TaxID=1502841 RepID=A0ABS3LNV1_9PROT|nr:pilus assembly protein PilN [Acetobacter suratthaniensis]MBO1329044.1 pilus assembly protein PilN [Acetobacter suratthaniensis]MCX2566935.1 pilus assembly protein PilN [Acetobacter suratthaniensis]